MQLKAEKEIPLESKSRLGWDRAWNSWLALVLLGLALSSVVQGYYRQAFLTATPTGVPVDFPHYYMAGRLARLRPPENTLYFPPADHRPTSYTELRTDATTPYGRSSGVGGLPDGAVTMPFDAPPFSALLMASVASLRWDQAYFVWQVLSALMIGVAVYFAVGLAQGGPPSILVAALTLVIAFNFMPVNRAISLGNIDPVILLLWVLGVFLLQRRRVAPSAFCFALGTAIKLSPIYAVPLFALRRQWRWLAWYLIWTVILLVASVWKVGWQNHVLWATQVAPALSCGIRGFWSRSLPGLVFALSNPQRLMICLPGDHALCLVNKVLSGIVYGAFLFWCWRTSRDSRALVFEVTLLPLVVLLVSPMSWTQYYVLAVLPLIYLWMRSREFHAGSSHRGLILLAGCALLFGSAVPDHFAQVLGPAAELWLIGGWVAGTLTAIGVGMRMGKSWAAEEHISTGSNSQREVSRVASLSPATTGN